MMKTEWGKYMNQGNNEKIVKVFANRIDRMNAKFGREIPIPVENALEEALEEALDLSAYLSSFLLVIQQQIIIIKKRKKNNGK